MEFVKDGVGVDVGGCVQDSGPRPPARGASPPNCTLAKGQPSCAASTCPLLCFSSQGLLVNQVLMAPQESQVLWVPKVSRCPKQEPHLHGRRRGRSKTSTEEQASGP